jgi:hypothetical protein
MPTAVFKSLQGWISSDPQVTRQREPGLPSVPDAAVGKIDAKTRDKQPAAHANPTTSQAGLASRRYLLCFATLTRTDNATYQVGSSGSPYQRHATSQRRDALHPPDSSVVGGFLARISSTLLFVLAGCCLWNAKQIPLLKTAARTKQDGSQ